jgi:hypothetical protein
VQNSRELARVTTQCIQRFYRNRSDSISDAIEPISEVGSSGDRLLQVLAIVCTTHAMVKPAPWWESCTTRLGFARPHSTFGIDDRLH